MLSLTLPRRAAAQDRRPTDPTESQRGQRGAAPDIDRLLTRFDHEPDIRAVQKATLRHAREGSKPLDRWRRRARWANLVPDVGGEVAWLDQRDSEHRYDEDIETGENGRLKRDSASNQVVDDIRLRAVYGADLEFDLGGLIFDRDEIAIARESRQRVETRRALMARVTDLYFKRRKRQILLAVALDREWRRKLTLALELRSLTARIDALTGGWFRKQLDAHSTEGQP